uniref:6-phosphogluconolactonase n=1 Tax=Paramoeba aestuarina TaxID=180227 RepID=A0A7S4NNB6_9EUKA
MAASKDNNNIFVFENNDALSTSVAKFVAEKSAEAIKERGKFTVAFSGGSLPNLVGRFMKEKPLSEEVGWDKWFVFFADERYVDRTHPDSNCLACEKALFSHVGIPQNQIFAADSSLSLEECAADYDKKIADNVPNYEFDLILLGMGPDGHTASLFPGHPLLEEKKQNDGIYF